MGLHATKYTTSCPQKQSTEYIHAVATWHNIENLAS
ncbi:hypothetical protein OIU77_030582 [Salix suchowensis]|uniref:Uncharacterized protein n=1 Tax=Salix suchowensis TaxID=1278906 RepID=A0ABQ9BCG3_9ROSI|nr:hypothetical protein OIU77_030582 [Salix suchowensis]